jgi:phage protein D
MTDRHAYETLTPEFVLRLNGAELPPQAVADLIGITLVDDVDAPGMCVFTLSGWDGVKMEPRWIDDDLFAEGTSVELQMGYRNKMSPLFKGEITGLEPEFPEGQPPTLLVRSHDRRHRLMRASKTRTFTQMKDSDIATQVAGDAGLSPQVEDSGVTLPYLIQHNRTDLDFLLERARRIGFEVIVNDRELHFRKRQYRESEAIELRREVGLLEFMPRLSTLNQVESVEVRGWNIKEKAAWVSQAGADTETARMAGKSTGPGTVQQTFPGSVAVNTSAPVASQEDADSFARGMLHEMGLHYINAEGVCIGEPELKAGSVVKIEGMGRRFSGLYYVTATEHRFRPRKGYRTAFVARRNAS